MTTSSWSKFTLLMWKNWILQWRHKLQTVIEILVPVVFSSLLVLIRSLVNPTDWPDVTTFYPIPFNNFTDRYDSIYDSYKKILTKKK